MYAVYSCLLNGVTTPICDTSVTLGLQGAQVSWRRVGLRLKMKSENLNLCQVIHSQIPKNENPKI